MYAVIESCGKQYKVAEGDVVFFEKLDTAEGKKVTFDKVILVSDDGKVQVGNPYVKGVKVEGKVVAHGKAKKIIVFKMKAKKNERTKQGHRPPYTKVEITGIKSFSRSLFTATVAVPIVIPSLSESSFIVMVSVLIASITWSSVVVRFFIPLLREFASIT